MDTENREIYDFEITGFVKRKKQQFILFISSSAHSFITPALFYAISARGQKSMSSSVTIK